MQFSRSEFPNGGWVFYQPQIGWWAPTPKGSTFDQTVHLIIKARRNNPAAMVAHKLSLDPVAVGNELEAYTRMRLGLPKHDAPLYPLSPPQSSNLPVAELDDIRRLAVGAGMAMDWSDSKEPAVSADVMSYRSRKCVACPMNSVQKLKDWKDLPVASAIRERVKRLLAMALPTESNPKLGLCENLSCPSWILAAEPRSIIDHRLTAELVRTSHPDCWLREK